MTEKISTGRLRLEPLTGATAQAILDGDLPAPARKGLATQTTRSTGCAASPTADLAWLVTLDGTVIGDLRHVGGIGDSGEVEIGYGLGRPVTAAGGYGTELVRGLTGWLLRQPGVQRVVASTRTDNLASRGALERAGFHLTGGAGGAHDAEVRYALPG